MTHKKTASLMRADRLNTLTSILIVPVNSVNAQHTLAVLIALLLGGAL